MKIQDFFKKWTSTRPNLRVSFNDAGIEAMAFAEAYHTEQLRLHVVGKRFNDLTDALGYLNRGGHHFEERNTLENATIIAIANDIYYNKNGTHEVG